MVFLGHIVSSKCIEVDTKKLDSVEKWHRPLLQIDIRRFFGLIGHYWKFVEVFSYVASHLMTLTKINISLSG